MGTDHVWASTRHVVFEGGVSETVLGTPRIPGADPVDGLQLSFGLLGGPQSMLAIIGGIAVLGAAVLLSRVRGGSDKSDPMTATEADESIAKAGAQTDRQPVSSGMLEALEPIAPEHVERARTQLNTANTPSERGEQIEQVLRDGIEQALVDGAFDPAVTSRYGTTYEIVNLPSEYRDVAIPTEQSPVHVSEIESVIREYIDESVPVQETIRTVAAIHDHCESIERYIESRESSVAAKRREVEDLVGDVRALVGRLDGDIGERSSELVLEGRRDGGAGVVDIERRISSAVDSTHSCAFEDAERILADARAEAETLLVTVDFLGAVTGTLDHGHGSATIDIPSSVDTTLLGEIESTIERQYDVTLSRANGQYRVDYHGTQHDDSTTAGSHGQARTSGRSRRDRIGGHRRPEAIADEILYVLRELTMQTDPDTDSIEFQTGSLPDNIATEDVLAELVAFCERQGDIVAAVSLQEDAPPGFLTLEFTGDRTTEAGGRLLCERFEDKYG